jgi:hypothetical protein
VISPYRLYERDAISEVSEIFMQANSKLPPPDVAYKGKPISKQDSSPWEDVIVADFAEFRKAGLTHPMMADIEKELGVSR